MSLEYAGVVVIAGVLVAGLVTGTTAQRERITCEVRGAVGVVTRGAEAADCGQPIANDPPPPPTPSEPPPVRNAICEPDGEGGSAQTPQNLGASVKFKKEYMTTGEGSISAKVGHSRRLPFADKDGYTVQSTDITYSMDGQLAADMEAWGVGSGIATGRSFKAALSGPTVDRYGADFPNPLTPTGLLPGDTMQWSTGEYSSEKDKATYHGWSFGGDVKDSRETGVAVTGLPDGKVAVSVGPQDTLQNDAFLAFPELKTGNVGVDLKTGLTSSRTTRSGNTNTYVLDLRTPEGVETYRKLAFQAKAPEAGAAGLDDHFTQRTEEYKRRDSAGVDGKIKLPWAELDAEIGGDYYQELVKSVVTDRDDGSYDADFTFVRGSQSILVNQQYDTNGSLLEDQTSYVITDQNVPPGWVEGYNDLWVGQDTERPDRPVNMSITLQQSDFDLMRQQAVDRVRAVVAEHPGATEVPGWDGGDISDVDLAAWVAQADPADLGLLESRGLGAPMAVQVLRSKGNAHMMSLMWDHSNLAEYFSRWADEGATVPGGSYGQGAEFGDVVCLSV